MEGPAEHLLWEERSRKRVASCSLFDLYLSERSSTRGKRGEFCIVAAPDWVNVVPLTRNIEGEDCFLMVRQYRHGAEMITTEFPAGLVEPGEDPRAAAERELEEETGRRAGRMTLIGRVSPNPAFMTNWCSTYLAEELALVHAGKPDETEALDAIEVPVRAIGERMGTGELVNSLAIVAFLWYLRRKNGAP
jgi:8-oxo-dGTP pyrophosphatase MutT (NUDIX family)